jgi:hypothetical protein
LRKGKRLLDWKRFAGGKTQLIQGFSGGSCRLLSVFLLSSFGGDKGQQVAQLRGRAVGHAASDVKKESGQAPTYAEWDLPDQATVQWTVARAVGWSRKAEAKGCWAIPDGWKSGCDCLGGRGNAPARGRQARPDLSRDKSGKCKVAVEEPND